MRQQRFRDGGHRTAPVKSAHARGCDFVGGVRLGSDLPKKSTKLRHIMPSMSSGE
jgi:hypothetical protein